jgi:hypothetical protein
MNRYAIVSTIAMIAFMASETMIVTAQEQIDSTNSDKQEIIVTWLDANKTKTDTVPAISVSGEDFWKFFKPLLEQSNN